MIKGGKLEAGLYLHLQDPLDICVWTHLEIVMYSTPVNTVEELEQRIVKSPAWKHDKFLWPVTDVHMQ